MTRAAKGRQDMSTKAEFIAFLRGQLELHRRNLGSCGCLRYIGTDAVCRNYRKAFALALKHAPRPAKKAKTK